MAGQFMSLDTSQSLAGLSVLIVEDEPMVALDQEQIVARLGCTEVHCAHRLSDGLEVICMLQPDLCILDINLAGEPAFPLAERLEQLGVPFLLVTGYSDVQIPKQWLPKVIRKPYNPAEFEFLLCKLAERASVPVGRPVERTWVSRANYKSES
jgi:CheY-like chemotaxis protein